MTIITIIFDLGNVVLTNDWHYDCPEKFQAYSDYFGITYEDMERGWQAFWPQFCIGRITEDEFWRGFLETAGAMKMDTEHAKELWRKYQRPIENMIDLLDRLKQRYRLAALTTISKEWLDYKKKKYNLDFYFEAIFSSGYSGLAKPDPRMYERIIEKLDVNPEECLFIDDSERALLPARQMGMKTILFTNQKELEARLKELGINI